MKLSMTVVATNTLIAGREVGFTTALRFPFVVPIICQVGQLQSSTEGGALAYWVKLEVLQEQQGDGAAWRNVAQRVTARPHPLEVSSEH
jgi:hypothetical protein